MEFGLGVRWVPLPANTSTRDPQQGKAEYVADAVKQALLLPSDMTELRTLRTHKVFLGLKSDLAKVNKIWNSFICLPVLTFSSSFPFYLFFFNYVSYTGCPSCL